MQTEGQDRSTSSEHAVDVDPESRPGVPMHAEPEPAEGAHWTEPSRQDGADDHLHHAGIDRPTPVVGTAQPPHGLSGLLRQTAYEIPEHQARRWMLLMLADRVDVLESRVGDALSDPLERVGMARSAERVRGNPLPLVAGALAGAWLGKKILFR
jgi:hypothetical protein